MWKHVLKAKRRMFAQVNIAGRAAAIAPGSADNLASFAGVYQTHNLPEVAGKPADAGFELAISVTADGARSDRPHLTLHTCPGCVFRSRPAVWFTLYAATWRPHAWRLADNPSACLKLARCGDGEWLIHGTGQPAVSVNGSALGGWTFDAMNVLAWSEEAGVSAWLQFMVLPGGPVFMGSLKTADDANAGVHTVLIFTGSFPFGH